MRKSKNQLFILGAVLLGSLSSCNRGVGCPNNFSLDMETVDSVISILSFIF